MKPAMRVNSAGQLLERNRHVSRMFVAVTMRAYTCELASVMTRNVREYFSEIESDNM